MQLWGHIYQLQLQSTLKGPKSQLLSCGLAATLPNYGRRHAQLTLQGRLASLHSSEDARLAPNLSSTFSPVQVDSSLNSGYMHAETVLETLSLRSLSSPTAWLWALLASDCIGTVCPRNHSMIQQQSYPRLRGSHTHLQTK